MERFSHIHSAVASFARSNVDTDQIIPARFLHKPRSGGFGQYLFHDLSPGFPPGAQILVAGANFGCGSSRENAVWALYDHGFRVVIAPSFGDIFFNNCLKNGLLPVTLPLEAAPGERWQVDLEAQTVTTPRGAVGFPIDPFAKHCLLNGVDELDYTLSRMDEIIAFERGGGCQPA